MILICAKSGQSSDKMSILLTNDYGLIDQVN